MEKELNVNEFLYGGDYSPEQWLNEPGIIDKDFAIFKDAAINTVTVGIFSWAKLEPSEGHFDFSWLDDIFDRVEKMNGHIILATPSGARPAWLSQKYPEVIRTDSNGVRGQFGGRHNHCYTSPIYRQKVQEINQKLAEHFGKRSSLVMWHISNEYSGACYCNLCQQAFRDWLKAKYQTLDNLNHAWWNTFWSHNYSDWSQIVAPGPHSEEGNKGLNLDWKRFETAQTISFIENEIAPLREITPQIPVTTNLMSGNSKMDVFSDLNYQEIAKHLDLVSWDSYPAWGNDTQSTQNLGMKVGFLHDFFRSLKHQNFLIMENTPSRVNWHNVNRAKRPGQNELSSLQDLAHGADSVLYFQMRASRGNSEMFHGAVIEHRHPTENRTYQEVKKVGQDLITLKSLFPSRYQQAKVAFVFSYDNYWALNDAESYAKDKKIWQEYQKHYQFFYERDIPVDFVSPTDDFSQYQLLIDPMHFMMSQKYMLKLRDFVKNGGQVVGTFISGVVDENGLAYMDEWPKPLQEIYGIDPLETDVLYPTQNYEIDYDGNNYQVKDYCEHLKLVGAKGVAEYQSDIFKETPVITSHQLDKGAGYYLGARGNKELLTAFYEKIIKRLGLKPILPIEKLSTKISIQERDDKHNRYLFVQNFSGKTNQIVLKEKLFELLSQKEEQNLISIPAYGSKVYQIEK